MGFDQNTKFDKLLYVWEYLFFQDSIRFLNYKQKNIFFVDFFPNTATKLRSIRFEKDKFLYSATSSQLVIVFKYLLVLDEKDFQ